MSETTLIRCEEIRTVAVLGAGTMGHGIAQVAAGAGFEVALRDISDEAVGAGLARIRANLDKGVALGKVDPAERERTLARLRVTTDVVDAVREADVIIEAAPEQMAIKREIFAVVGAHAPARALLATNTSSLSVAEIGAAAGAPARTVGMHFFNPVHLMKLLEVVHHEATAPEAVACALALGERLGKTAICVRDVPGFASSRLGLALGLEAIRMVEQGVASPADIDTAMKLGYGHPMGPLELTDLVGLDVRLQIAEYLTGQLGDGFRVPELLRAKVAAGQLGRKTGEGFYRWEDGKRIA